MDKGFLDATALAEYLVNRGVPFRTAHQAVGKLVARAENEGKPLAELPLSVLREASGRIGKPNASFDIARLILQSAKK